MPCVTVGGEDACALQSACASFRSMLLKHVVFFICTKYCPPQSKLADRELSEARPRHNQIRGLSTRRSLVWPRTILGVAMACRSRHASSVEEAQQPVCMHLSKISDEVEKKEKTYSIPKSPSTPSETAVLFHNPQTASPKSLSHSPHPPSTQVSLQS